MARSIAPIYFYSKRGFCFLQFLFLTDIVFLFFVKYDCVFIAISFRRSSRTSVHKLLGFMPLRPCAKSFCEPSPALLLLFLNLYFWPHNLIYYLFAHFLSICSRQMQVYIVVNLCQHPRSTEPQTFDPNTNAVCL